jgi:hypothetical protein
VTDLTDADVREMKGFLSDCCAEVGRWLPGPEWEPGWQSEAARERANTAQGPAGPWGKDPVRMVYTAAALFLEAVLQCLRAMGDSLTIETTAYVPNCLARAAMEAGSQALWLLEPKIGARRRVARFLLIRASGARYLDKTVRMTDPGASGVYGETPAAVHALAAHLGLDCRYRGEGRDKRWWCDTEKLPTYTERNKQLENAVIMTGAYSIYSASAHAEWHAVMAGWRQIDMTGDQPSILMTRPDRVAVWSPVFAAASFAVAPASRALGLLDRRARLRDTGYWSENGLQLMRRMDLPREWWAD